MELRLESQDSTAVETCQKLTCTSAEEGNSKQNTYENLPENGLLKYHLARNHMINSLGEKNPCVCQSKDGGITLKSCMYSLHRMLKSRGSTNPSQLSQTTNKNCIMFIILSKGGSTEIRLGFMYSVMFACKALIGS